MFHSAECSPLGAGVFSCSLKGLHRTLDKCIAVFFLLKNVEFFSNFCNLAIKTLCPVPDLYSLKSWVRIRILDAKHCLTEVNSCISGHHGGESKENLTPQEASGKFPEVKTVLAEQPSTSIFFRIFITKIVAKYTRIRTKHR
jgi:hypothetical protein